MIFKKFFQKTKEKTQKLRKYKLVWTIISKGGVI